MQFEKMTVVQLKDYMRLHKIKGLTGRKAELIDRIQKFQNFGIDSNIISENDIKSSSDNNIYKMNVAQLKNFMRKHKIKGLTGKKSELIERIKVAGFSVDELQESKPISKKKVVVKQTRDDLLRKQLMSKNMNELINTLYDLGVAQGFTKIPKKSDLVELLISYYVFDEQGNPTLVDPNDIVMAEALLPIPENIQNAIVNTEDRYSGSFARGEFINRSSSDLNQMKYDPGSVRQYIDQVRSSEGIQRQGEMIPLILNDIIRLLPIRTVEEQLNNTRKNIVQFVSPYTTDRYDEADLFTDILMSDYNVPNWHFRIIERDGRYVLVYSRQITPKILSTQFDRTRVYQYLNSIMDTNIDEVQIHLPKFDGCRPTVDVSTQSFKDWSRTTRYEGDRFQIVYLRDLGIRNGEIVQREMINKQFI